MWAGGYSLDLYCENAGGRRFEWVDGVLLDEFGHSPTEFPHQFNDEHGSVCRQMARKAGWQVNKDGTAICPKCTRREKEMSEGKRKRKSTLTLVAEHLGTSTEDLKDYEYQPGRFTKPVYSSGKHLYAAGDTAPKEVKNDPNEPDMYKWSKVSSNYDPRYTIWVSQDLEE
jgi:uncharacterized Zn finger protein (UPF0148 family)